MYEQQAAEDEVSIVVFGTHAHSRASSSIPTRFEQQANEVGRGKGTAIYLYNLCASNWAVKQNLHCCRAPNTSSEVVHSDKTRRMNDIEPDTCVAVSLALTGADPMSRDVNPTQLPFK